MTTSLYGASDDLIEFDGDFVAEVAAYNDSLVFMSDGTVMGIKYGKGDLGIWALTLIKRGVLFEEIKHCTDESAAIYSDVAYFSEGITWAYVALKWKYAK